MKSPDYDRCASIALEVAQGLYNSSHPPIVCYGAYSPTSDISQWDDRWQALYLKEPWNYFQGFVHFWVECGDTIIDSACMQFGEPETITNINDIRYHKFGFMDIRTLRKHHLPDKPEILWNIKSRESVENAIFDDFGRFLPK